MGIVKKFRIKSFKNLNPIIEFENVSLSFGNRLILDNINFKINEGQIFGMLGPNGVGKSSIFNLLTGLIAPKTGKIKINMAIIKKFRIKSFKTINSIIEFKNISLAYGNRLILDNINFKINEGQIFGMLGPNGVGKSTILI